MNVAGKTLLIRADAGAVTGTGHVMRSLALAQAWQDQGGRVWYACCHLPGPLKERLEQEKISVYLEESFEPGSPEDARWTLEAAQQCQASWISVDGYCFKSGYQKQFKDRGARVLFFDDYGHCDYYHADLVLNGNVTASEALYPARSAETRLLLGPGFAPLRREFLLLKEKKRFPGSGSLRVLVTMGGSDPDNITCKIVRLIHSLSPAGLELTVLAGGGNPHVEEIKKLIQEMHSPCRLLINTTQMPELMREADIAIAAGGSTYLEALYMELPCLLFVLADNQSAIAARLEEMGVARLAGDSRTMDEGKIRELLADFLGNGPLHDRLRLAGRQVLDGRGAQRVLAAMGNEPERKQAFYD